MVNKLYSYKSDGFLMFTIQKQNSSNVKETLQSISNKYNVNFSNITKVKQIHSNKILFVEKVGKYGEYDGILTKNENIIPQIVTADCIPLFIYDFNEKYYGIIHCGWRGIASKIHINAVEFLLSKGCNINNIKIFTGPSIKKCCYKVGEDILHNFDSNSFCKINTDYFLDLSSQLTNDLTAKGINKDNITHSTVCTFDDEKCHSFRRDGVNSGRMQSIMIKI